MYVPWFKENIRGLQSERYGDEKLTLISNDLKPLLVAVPKASIFGPASVTLI
jgi:hypothetical protein